MNIVESPFVRIRVDRPKDTEMPEPVGKIGHRVVRAFEQSVTVIDRQSGSRKRIIFRPGETARQ